MKLYITRGEVARNKVVTVSNGITAGLTSFRKTI